MFYSHDILTSKRQTGLAVIWLAATLGPKHSFRKLSKREVNGVDVVRACDYLNSPPEPLALRLTSNLMVGVTRVYSQQYMHFYMDVNQVFMKLKRVWTDAQSKDLNMPTAEARFEAITMNVDEDIELSREQPLVILVNSMMEKQMDLGWLQAPDEFADSSSGMTRSNPAVSILSNDATSFDASSHVGSLKSITLQGPSTLNASPYGGARASDSGMFFPDLLLGPLEQDTLDLDFGGNDQIDLFADVEKDHMAARKKRRVHQDVDDIDANLLAEGLGAPFHQDNYLSPPHIQEMQHTDVGGVEDYPEIETAPPIAGEVETVAKVRRKRKDGLIDATTELSHDEMISMRNQASADLIAAERQAAIKARNKSDKILLQGVLQTPAIDVGSDLTQFWRNTVLLPKRPHGGNEAEMHRKRARHDGYIQGEHQQGGGAYDNQPYFDDLAGAADTSSGNKSVDDLEMFRAGDERRKSEIMPWHTSSRAGSANPETPGSGRRTPRSAHKSASARDSLFAFGSEDFGEMSRGFGGSYAGSFVRDVSPLKDFPEYSGLDDPGIGFDLNFGVDSVERETSQFLNYVRDIAHAADTNYVHFFDLLPVNATTRVAASQAFYHVLALSTRDIIVPKQEVPFEDIRVELK